MGERACEAALRECGAANELAFMHWAKNATKSCPGCGVRVQRNEDYKDCNHMICGACKAEWCWLCRALIPPTGHFDPTNTRGCPGLQYAGPNISLLRRSLARTRAISVQAGGVTRSVAVQASKITAAVAVSPFLLLAALPLAARRGWNKRRERRHHRAYLATTQEQAHGQTYRADTSTTRTREEIESGEEGEEEGEEEEIVLALLTEGQD